jgi:hypothetical protein
MAQVVEYLLSKYDALSSTPGPPPKNQTNKIQTLKNCLRMWFRTILYIYLN